MSNLMLACTQSQVNSFFHVHFIETHVFNKFICVFKIVAVFHEFTRVYSSMHS